jgi:hypothetical protein
MQVHQFFRRHAYNSFWLSAILLAFLNSASAQPTLVSVVPANGATGVSQNTTVVFTFSTAMDTNATTAFFIYDGSSFVATVASWNAGHTVMTNTPVASFPANKTITWLISGQDTLGNPLDGTGSDFGSFSTGGGGGGSGTGTNAITSFTLGKIYYYDQTSAAAPTVDTSIPYNFDAVTALSSNRTATNVTLLLPTGGISNLVQNFLRPEDFTLFSFKTNQASFDATFPPGSYVFTVRSVNSNQTVPVNFPSTLLQPGVPHITNYTAVQAVNPAQPFTLGWDGFIGGTLTDFVSVAIGESFSSTNAGSPGALNGTATSITIPAGTLQPNSNYDSTLSFFRVISITNGSSNVTTVYRATITQFTLTTTSSSTGPIILTNTFWNAGSFSFDVLCSTGQTVTVEYKTNLATGVWQSLVTTNNNQVNRYHIISSPTTNRARFFRARNGS